MNDLCTAIDRAFVNRSRSCLKCYNLHLLKDERLHCPFTGRKKGMMPGTIKALIDYAREKAKDCKNYDGEF